MATLRASIRYGITRDWPASWPCRGTRPDCVRLAQSCFANAITPRTRLLMNHEHSSADEAELASVADGGLIVEDRGHGLFLAWSIPEYLADRVFDLHRRRLLTGVSYSAVLAASRFRFDRGRMLQEFTFDLLFEVSVLIRPAAPIWPGTSVEVF